MHVCVGHRLNSLVNALQDWQHFGQMLEERTIHQQGSWLMQHTTGHDGRDSS